MPDAAEEALELVQVLCSCGHAWLCNAVLLLCNAVPMLCRGYANAMQGYACSRPTAVQSPDRGCAGSGLWLCWRSQWVQVWVCVGPSEGPCGSMYDTVWSGFALIWSRETDILRCFELQMWKKRGLEARSCLPAEVLHVIAYLSTNIHRCSTHVRHRVLVWLDIDEWGARSCEDCGSCGS